MLPSASPVTRILRDIVKCDLWPLLILDIYMYLSFYCSFLLFSYLLFLHFMKNDRSPLKYKNLEQVVFKSIILNIWFSPEQNYTCRWILKKSQSVIIHFLSCEFLELTVVIDMSCTEAERKQNLCLLNFETCLPVTIYQLTNSWLVCCLVFDVKDRLMCVV